jgi:hypothetical protein
MGLEGFAGAAGAFVKNPQKTARAQRRTGGFGLAKHAQIDYG